MLAILDAIHVHISNNPKLDTFKDKIGRLPALVIPVILPWLSPKCI